MMEIVAVALPPVLLAVTGYEGEDDVTVGGPEMAPVVVENERPEGNDGEIDHDVTVPPLDVGVTVVMAVPLVRVYGLPL